MRFLGTLTLGTSRPWSSKVAALRPGIHQFKLGVSITTLLSLAACNMGGSGAGEVAIADVEMEEVIPLLQHGSAVQIDRMENGVDFHEIVKRYRDAGYDVEVEAVDDFGASGRHGDTVNLMMSRSDFVATFKGTLSKKRQLGIEWDDDEYRVSATYYGPYIDSAYFNVNLSKKYKQGPFWNDVAHSVLENMNASKYLSSLPASLGGTVSKSIDVPPLGENGTRGTVLFEIVECRDPKDKGGLAAPKKRGADFYANHVCGTNLSHLHENGEYRLKYNEVMRAKYVAKFGEPDCWDWQSGCFKGLDEQRIQAELKRKLAAARASK